MYGQKKNEAIQKNITTEYNNDIIKLKKRILDEYFEQ